MTSRALPPRPAGARRASECARFVEKGSDGAPKRSRVPGSSIRGDRAGEACQGAGGEGGCGLVGSPLAGVMTSDRHQAEEHAGCADAQRRQDGPSLDELHSHAHHRRHHRLAGEHSDEDQRPDGILANVIVGVIGSFLGVFVANAMGVRPTRRQRLDVAILGAALLIALLPRSRRLQQVGIRPLTAVVRQGFVRHHVGAAHQDTRRG